MTRFFTRVDLNPLNPEPRGICDRCGQQYTLSALRWQHQYIGGAYQNRRILVCPICLDDPSTFLKILTLPVDPPSIFNSRSEPYAIDEASQWDIIGFPGSPMFNSLVYMAATLRIGKGIIPLITGLSTMVSALWQEATFIPTFIGASVTTITLFQVEVYAQVLAPDLDIVLASDGAYVVTGL